MWRCGPSLRPWLSFVPGFGFPEPLTSYVLALPLVWCAMRFGLIWPGVVAGFVVALDVPWPFQGYNPAELAAWILCGVLAWRYCGDGLRSFPGGGGWRP